MTWDGQPEHRNLGGGDGGPRPPFGRWRDFFGDPPAPVPRPESPGDPEGAGGPQMPADPFNGLAEPAVAQVAMIEAVREAGLPPMDSLAYVAWLVQAGLALQNGKLAPPPEET